MAVLEAVIEGRQPPPARTGATAADVAGWLRAGAPR
jgi:hypothetical protein